MARGTDAPWEGLRCLGTYDHLARLLLSGLRPILIQYDGRKNLMRKGLNCGHGHGSP
jgi:hypothetical protein